MGGRNGGAMGKKRLSQKEREKKDNVVTMPQRGGGEDAEAGGNGDEKGAVKRSGKSKEKATKEDEKAKRKGAKKAWRHAVKKVVKENSEPLAGTLVEGTKDGDMHCAAVMTLLMEKKKKDGEDDEDWDGPGLSEILVPSQLWRGNAAAKQTENDEENEAEAA